MSLSEIAGWTIVGSSLATLALVIVFGAIELARKWA